MSELQAIPGIHIALASVDEIERHGQDLLRAHAEEAEPDLAEHVSPDWDTYIAGEEAGSLIVLTACNGSALPDGLRTNEVLIGYAVAAVFRSPHYDRLFCQHDLLYVLPEWRGTGIGLRLIAGLREQARERGCHRLIMHAKVGSTLGAMLPRLGFRVEETMFVEDL